MVGVPEVLAEKPGRDSLGRSARAFEAQHAVSRRLVEAAVPHEVEDLPGFVDQPVAQIQERWMVEDLDLHVWTGGKGGPDPFELAREIEGRKVARGGTHDEDTQGAGTRPHGRTGHREVAEERGAARLGQEVLAGRLRQQLPGERRDRSEVPVGGVAAQENPQPLLPRARLHSRQRPGELHGHVAGDQGLEQRTAHLAGGRPPAFLPRHGTLAVAILDAPPVLPQWGLPQLRRERILGGTVGGGMDEGSFGRSEGRVHEVGPESSAPVRPNSDLEVLVVHGRTGSSPL